MSAAIASLASIFPLVEHLRAPDRPSDFGIVWFGARSLLQGVNPYPLVGPGRLYEWDWGLFYPATSFVAAMPLAWLPEAVAATLFVWISTALLAYGITKNGWDLLFLFPSSAFIIAARAAQWSPLFSAAWCMPWLGIFFAAKPNSGIPFLAAAASRKLLIAGITGGAALTIISLALLPSWPKDWLATINTADNLRAPIVHMGGAFTLLALLKWRRPEARLIVALACVPQAAAWYSVLPLLLVASTRRESQILSLVSSVGFISIRFIVTGQPEAQFIDEVTAIMIAFAYLPATIMVLRRPNKGQAKAMPVPLLPLSSG